jgi:hypothetical protein
MTRAMFAETLRDAILTALIDFGEQHPSETPYAFALVGGLNEGCLGYAMATEQRLLSTAEKYDLDGYRYQSFDWEQFDNREKLATWLRWANPDDGWMYGDFSDHFEVQVALRQLLDSGEFHEDVEGFEEFCTEILYSLNELPGWRELSGVTGGKPIIVGFTDGENPRDFLRTATRANPYPFVMRLWRESWQVDEIDPKIKRDRCSLKGVYPKLPVEPDPPEPG